MATMEGKFIDGCAASGTAPAVAKDLWSLMTAAADYSFNKSHAACYALISYRTAYLKANYPAEYMAAVISSVMSTKDKVPFFVNKCDGDGDRGAAARRQLLRPRLRRQRQVDPLRPRRGQERRPRRGRDDHLRRARADGRSSRSGTSASASTRAAVNKRAIECLVKCGALDSTGDPRRGMLEVLAQAQSAGQKAQEDSRRGQGSIFDLGGGGGRGGAAHGRRSRARGTRRCPARSSTSARCCGSRRRRSGRSSPPTRWARSRDALRAAGRAAARRRRRAGRRRLGDGRRDRRRGQEGPHARAAAT